MKAQICVGRAESRDELAVENPILIEIVNHRRVLSILRAPEADVTVVITDRVTRDDDLCSLPELIRVVAAHFKILALPDLLAADVFERADQKIAVFEDDFAESHVLAH